MYFPGVTTQWKSYPASTPGAWEQSYSTKAHAEASYIAKEIAAVRDAGVDLADGAMAFIEEASEFTVDNAPNVVYSPPALQRAAIHGAPVVPYFDVTTLNELIGDAKAEAFDLRLQQKNVSAPLGGTLSTTDTPLSAVSAYTAVPAPNLGTYTPPTYQDFTFSIQSGAYSPPDHAINAYTPLPFPGTSGVNIEIGAFTDPLASDIKGIETDQLDETLADLQAYIGGIKLVSVSDYESLDDNVAELVGNMLSGTTDFSDAIIVSSEQLFTTNQVTHNVALSEALSTYGAPGDVSPYLQRRQARKEAEQLTHTNASRAKFRLEVIAAGQELAGQLYVAVLRRRQQLIELEAKALEAQIEAARALNEALKDAYRAKVAIYGSMVRAQRVVYEIAEQKAAQHKIEVRKQQILADKAKQEYTAYATRESAKLSVLQSLHQIAATNAARAKVFTLEQQIEARDAQAQAELALTKHKNSILKWSTSLDDLKAKLGSYQARAQVVSATNSIESSRQQIEDANYGRAEAEARKEASKAAASLTDMSYRASERQTKLMQQASNNQIFQTKVATHNERRELDFANYGTQIAVQRDTFRAKVAQNQAAAQFYSTATQSMGRAARLSQQANIDLATAYASVQEAVGRAYAAVENGKLSGWSAASTLSAQGSLSASTTSGRTISTSYSTQTSEGDQESEQVSVNG